MLLRNILLILIIFIHYSISFSISQPPFKVTQLDYPSPGYLIMDSYLPGYVYLTDNSGQPVYIKSLSDEDSIFNLKMQSDGLLSFYSEKNKKFYIIDTSFTKVDSFECFGGYETDFNQFDLLPNGNVIIVGKDIRTVDMSQIVSGGKKDAIVVGNIIQEIDSGKKLVFEWDTFDHYNYTDIANDDDLKSQTIDFSRINGVSYDTDGNLIVSASGLDEITKINRGSGEIIWRMGGTKCKNNQYNFLNDDIDGFFGFSNQHSLTKLSNGDLLMFDNGNLRPKPFSRAVEYQIDENNKTIKKVWNYRIFPDIFSGNSGSVQRLEGGNTVIGWGDNIGKLTMSEVREDGSTAMEINDFISNSVFRNIIKMAAKTLICKSQGSYDFNDSLNYTGIVMSLNSVSDTGIISVERHYYKPHNISFGNGLQMDVYPNRWVVSNHGMNEISGVMKFDLRKINGINPAKAIIYARAIEGKGEFYPLTTAITSDSFFLETGIIGFGEFILCSEPKIGIPSLNYPGKDSQNIETNVIFSWIPLINADAYHFQLAKDSEFNIILVDSSGINVANIICNNLEYNTKYFWRVKALSDTNQGEWSEIWNFTTTQRKVLDPPNLKSPYYDSTGVPVNGYLRWAPVLGAKYYNIELSLNNNFDSIILSRTRLNATFIYYNGLENNTKYYWHVNAMNDITIGSWSDIWKFTTVNPSSVSLTNGYNDFVKLTDNNGTLQFRFNNDKTDYVFVTITDITGRIITTLKNNNSEPGENIIMFDSRYISDGIYFYDLICNDKIYHGKFIINSNQILN